MLLASDVLPMMPAVAAERLAPNGDAPPGPGSGDWQERYRREDNVVQEAAPRSAPDRVMAEQTPERRLRIAMLAPPWIPVPPPGYGGIEFVVALVCDALVEHEHDVELFCAPGSQSRAKVHPLLPSAHPESIERALFEGDHVGRAFRSILASGAAGEPFDVIHDHSGYVALAMADRIDLPMVHTVHGPFDDDTKPYYAVNGRNGAISCISKAQAGMAPDPEIVDAVVHNPIDIDAWPLGTQKDEYLLWVGRFVAEKGPQRAIQVAKKAGRPLVLGGVVQPGQERFFANEIEPHIDGETIRYVGEIGGARKQRFFADAYAFLMPIRWAEPFGMVMVEAMAAGTPVLAFPEGAAPEVVEHGVSGFLVSDEDEMAAMVDDAGRLDPLQVRRSAERFAPDRIALGYERVYWQAMRERAPATER
jgi:glycosyltransferase involved in cell wall biosynthesis